MDAPSFRGVGGALAGYSALSYRAAIFRFFTKRLPVAMVLPLRVGIPLVFVATNLYIGALVVRTPLACAIAGLCSIMFMKRRYALLTASMSGYRSFGYAIAYNSAMC